MGQAEGGCGADEFPGYGVAVDGGEGGDIAEGQTDQQEPSVSSEYHLIVTGGEGKEHEAGERTKDGELRVLELGYVLLELMCILQQGGILELNNEGTRGVGKAAALSAWHIQDVGNIAAPSVDKEECIEAAGGVEAVVVDSEVEDTGKLAAGKGGVLMEL